MAFNLQALIGTTIYELNNGSPFALTSFEGGGIPPTRRLTERGPQQHGDTNLGVRLDPRVITMGIDVHGTSATDLDTQRDSLRTIFAPSKATPVKLRITRDDGEVRQIDCYTSGRLDVPLVTRHRPGNLHRVAVQLLANDPVWYDPTATVGTITTVDSWWLALQTIGSANVMEYVDDVAQNTTWTWAGTISAGNPFTIVFRSGKETLTAFAKYAWNSTNDNGNDTAFVAHQSGEYQVDHNASTRFSGTGLMTSGTHNYFSIYSYANDRFYLYRDTALIGVTPGATGDVGLRGSGKWRGQGGLNNWDEEIPKAAVYDIELNSTQIAALSNSMGGTVALSGSVIYSGDWMDNPVIRINGPVSDPVVTNTATNEKLDFTGATIGSGNYYEIDTRYGNKTVVDSSNTSQIGNLSSDSNLETFHMAPSTEVTGGTNPLSLAGTATGETTSIVYTYYNRYTGFLMAIEYALYFKDRSSVLQYVLTGGNNGFRSLSYTKRVNQPGLLTFEININHALVSDIATDWQIEVRRRDDDEDIDWYTDFFGFFRDEVRNAPNLEAGTFTGYAIGQMDLLARSIIAYRANTTNRSAYTAQPAETIAKSLVTYNAGTAGVTGDGRIRDVDAWGAWVSVEADGATGATIDYRCAYKNTLESLQEVASIGSGDFNLINTAGTAWEFRWYNGQLGTDRSGSVTFSLAYGNMAMPELRRSRMQERTVAIVGGKGEEADRTIATRTGDNYDASYNSREVFVSATQYATAAGLNAAGDQALDRLTAKDDLQFEVKQIPASLYGKHYFLGDLITGRFQTVEATKQITAVSVQYVDQGSNSVEKIQIETADA